MMTPLETIHHWQRNYGCSAGELIALLEQQLSKAQLVQRSPRYKYLDRKGKLVVTDKRPLEAPKLNIGRLLDRRRALLNPAEVLGLVEVNGEWLNRLQAKDVLLRELNRRITRHMPKRPTRDDTELARERCWKAWRSGFNSWGSLIRRMEEAQVVVTIGATQHWLKGKHVDSYVAEFARLLRRFGRPNKIPPM